MHVGDIFPPSFTVPLSLKSTLRYGENPHQKAAFYGDKSLSVYNVGGIATAVQHHGKVSRSFSSVLAKYSEYLPSVHIQLVSGNYCSF